MKQIVIYFSRVLSFILRTQITDKIDVDRPSENCIIVLNHVHAMDPPLALGSMPKDMYEKLSPYAFMTKNKYLHVPVLGWILKSIGCYPAKSEPGAMGGLDASKELLKKGARIVIFPEGTVVKPGREYRNHHGVSVLANEAGVKILPIRIKQRKPGTSIFGWNRIFRNIDIIYGQPFDGAGMSPDEIMKRVYALEP